MLLLQTINTKTEITNAKGAKMKRLILIWENLIHHPTARKLAISELEASKRSFLEMKRNEEYYTHMVNYELGRIERLERYLEGETPLESTMPKKTPRGSK